MIDSGSAVLNALLQGGYEPWITGIYGTPATGKSLCCMLAAVACAKRMKKVAYVDTEQNFHAERALQLCPDTDALGRILRLCPGSFSELNSTVVQLGELAPHLGLICVDSLTSDYRLGLAGAEDHKSVNDEFVKITEELSRISKENHIPVVITAQAYLDIENKAQRMVGGFILPRRCKVILLLEKKGRMRYAILEKHPTLSHREERFRITDTGIEPIPPRSFPEVL